MSHFSVAVITKDEPTDDVLLAALEPYEEFECTGRETRFIQEIDQTDEMRRDYERHTSPKLRDAAGTLHDPYDDKFYRDPTQEELDKHKPMLGTGSGGGISWHSKDWDDGKGYRPKVRFIPDGMVEVSLPDRETKTFVEFIKDWSGKKVVPFGNMPDIKDKHKYGYVLTDKDGNVTKVIDRTNPNKKWDWFSVGGRYRGQLLAKAGRTGIEGEPGAFGNKAWRDGGLDSLKVGDIDFARMRGTAEIERRSAIDKAILAIQANSPDLTREAIYSIHAAAARALPQAKAAWQAEAPGQRFWDWLKTSDNEHAKLVAYSDQRGVFESLCGYFSGTGLPETEPDIDAWIARAPMLQVFAVLHDGEWKERGSMGWWGVVTDEKDKRSWEEEVSDFLGTLDPESWLTVVDCHI